VSQNGFCQGGSGGVTCPVLQFWLQSRRDPPCRV